jgi:type VI secretion system secreted protein Hcp
MANDIFVDIEGIEGESQDALHPKAIQALSWSWSVEQNAQMLSGSGGGSPKATVQDIAFVHYIDRASPNLSSFCSQGKHIDRVTLTSRKAGGTPFEYHRLTMFDVIVSGVHSTVTEFAATQTVSLSFTRVMEEYIVQSALGQPKGTVTALIDVRQNTVRHG